MPSLQSFQLRTISGFFLCFIALTSCLPAIAADYASVGRAVVNIRAGSSTETKALWMLYRDYPLQIIQQQGEWSQIEDHEGDSGWIYSSLLSTKKTVIVKTNSANLRSGPGQNHEKIASVESGVVFDFLKREGKWLKLKHEDGTEGWLYSNLVWPTDLL